jgi:hypothetical protein
VGACLPAARISLPGQPTGSAIPRIDYEDEKDGSYRVIAFLVVASFAPAGLVKMPRPGSPRATLLTQAAEMKEVFGLFGN